MQFSCRHWCSRKIWVLKFPCSLTRINKFAISLSYVIWKPLTWIPATRLQLPDRKQVGHLLTANQSDRHAERVVNRIITELPRLRPRFERNVIRKHGWILKSKNFWRCYCANWKVNVRHAFSTLCRSTKIIRTTRYFNWCWIFWINYTSSVYRIPFGTLRSL
jgi:hypothetical protein